MAPATAPAPFELHLIGRKLVKPEARPQHVGGKQAGGGGGGSGTQPSGSSTQLNACDVVVLTTTTVRCFAWERCRLDAGALEEALARTLADLPVLAGRLRLRTLSLSSAWVEHTGGGAQLTVAAAPDVRVAWCVSGRARWGRQRLACGSSSAPCSLFAAALLAAPLPNSCCPPARYPLPPAAWRRRRGPSRA